jgi:rare lipoprotein A
MCPLIVTLETVMYKYLCARLLLPLLLASVLLPFGTRLEVCYQGCTTVRINDRGPYIGERELDLSYGAARAIGMIDTGVANIEVTYL